MHTSRNAVSIAEAYEPLINAYGQSIVDAVITGGAVSSPRSTIPNYAEILVAVIVRTPNQSKFWIESLMAIVSLVAFGRWTILKIYCVIAWLPWRQSYT